MKKVKIRWRCPACGHKHKWRWPADSILPFAGRIIMECDMCEAETPCRMDKDGNVEVVG